MTFEDDFLRVKGVDSDLTRDLEKAVGEVIQQQPTLKQVFKGAADDIRSILDTEDNSEQVSMQYAKEHQAALEMLPKVSESCNAEGMAMFANELGCQAHYDRPTLSSLKEALRNKSFATIISESTGIDWEARLKKMMARKDPAGLDDALAEIMSMSHFPGRRMDKDTADGMTNHRPASETEPKFLDPLGGNRSLQREKLEKRKGTVIKFDDKTNDTGPTADIPLVNAHDSRDPMTGLVPFEDNGGRKRRKSKMKPFKFRGAGGGKPGSDMRETSTKAVEFDSIYTEDLRSLSAPSYQMEGRRFLLKQALPKLTKDQRKRLAQAFMAHDEEGITEILSLINRVLPYMTYRKGSV